MRGTDVGILIEEVQHMAKLCLILLSPKDLSSDLANLQQSIRFPVKFRQLIFAISKSRIRQVEVCRRGRDSGPVDLASESAAEFTVTLFCNEI